MCIVGYLKDRLIYDLTSFFIVYISMYYVYDSLFLPDVGPDTKYLFGFIRTQLSTSVTIALIFGPKVRSHHPLFVKRMENLLKFD